MQPGPQRVRPVRLKAVQWRALQKTGGYKRSEVFLGAEAAIALRQLIVGLQIDREAIEALLLAGKRGEDNLLPPGYRRRLHLALGRLASFEAALGEPWLNASFFWEGGMLGQVLFLKAEVAGVRATGIGCFSDDEMHALLGINDHASQSLYHFTLGGAVDDRRLSALPLYKVSALKHLVTPARPCPEHLGRARFIRARCVTGNLWKEGQP